MGGVSNKFSDKRADQALCSTMRGLQLILSEWRRMEEHEIEHLLAALWPLVLHTTARSPYSVQHVTPVFTLPAGHEPIATYSESEGSESDGEQAQAYVFCLPPSADV